MPEYARVCQSMPEYARECQSMPEYARVCQSMPEYARVCQSMPEYARDDLIVVGIGDASFKSEEKAVGGVLLFLANSQMTRASLIYWKAKIISRVCQSSKDAETLD